MNATEIRTGFDRMIAAAAAAGDSDAVARMEVAREYLTNASFKKTLQDHLWNMTQARLEDGGSLDV